MKGRKNYFWSENIYLKRLLAIRLNIRLIIGFKNTGTYQGYI